MSRRKKILLGILGVLLFILFVLPYLLPLNGPATVDPATLADPNGAFVQAGDTRMYYQKAGTGGAPIVLVHGFGASSFSWRVPESSTTASSSGSHAMPCSPSSSSPRC